MINKMSLHHKLIGLLILLVVVPVVIVSVFSFSIASKIINDNAGELTRQVANEKVSYIDLHNLSLKHDLESLSFNRDVLSQNRESLLNALGSITRSNNDILQSYLGDESKQMTVYPESVKIPENFDPTSREWYKKALASNGGIYVSGPYKDALTGKIVITLAKAVHLDDGRKGAVAFDVDLSTLRNRLTATKVGKSGYAILISREGTIIADSDRSKIMKNIKSEIPSGQSVLGEKQGNIKYGRGKESKIAGFNRSKETGWTVVAVSPKSDYAQALNYNLTTAVIVLLVMIAVAVICGIAVAKYATGPLAQIQQFARRLSKCDFSTPINMKRRDEFADTALSLNTAQKNVKSLVKTIVENSENMSASSQELSATVQEMTSKFQNINESISDIVNGSQETTASAQEVTASVEEIDSNINQLSNQAMNVNENANNSKENALSVQKSAQEAIEECKSIYKDEEKNILKAIEDGKVVSKIKEMADIIANIAEQTNLLALNAAIEAARAGEHGKGFAVVAEEVRKLAEQSSETVSTIQDVVEKVQEAFKNLSDASHQTLRFIDENVNLQLDNYMSTGERYYKDSQFTSDSLSHLTSMTEDIKNTTNEVTKAVSGMAGIAQKSSESTNQIQDIISDAAQEMIQVDKTAREQSDSAQKLNVIIQKFKI
ncbi:MULTISPECIES: methyl-accepting chemotaxis protein [Clostridium]|uniref:Methyl-accepting chemotaxis protein n=1 Tax=Clostridium lapidicellarium TaxID=3240931 RepID=A0ABV4DWM3_9CLOT|nr:methyl-accepting chemotaxis protein [uncultured Clostridium sp.]NLU07542.1 methyl-accepting chemotaxis protein [Clostridiales bacterium]